MQVGAQGLLDRAAHALSGVGREAFWSDPDRFAEELERNPQWINERVRRVARDGDLFAA